jgi:hypothetical protein
MLGAPMSAPMPNLEQLTEKIRPKRGKISREALETPADVKP